MRGTLDMHIGTSPRRPSHLPSGGVPASLGTVPPSAASSPPRRRAGGRSGRGTGRRSGRIGGEVEGREEVNENKGRKNENGGE